MIEISPKLNEYRLQGVILFLSQGTNPAVARIYSGERPAFGGLPNGALLAEIILPEPIGTIAGGVLNVAPSDEVMVLADGDAVWARLINGEGNIGWDCTVSDLHGSGDLKLAATGLYAGGYVRITSGVLS